MPDIDETLKLVIETAFAGVSQMPRRLESEAERAICRLERLLKDGWELRPPERRGMCGMRNHDKSCNCSGEGGDR